MTTKVTAHKTTKTRRGHGEGSIHKRGEGWQGALELDRDPITKLRVRQTVYGKTRREVADQLDALRADKRSGKRAPSALTVGEYLTSWLGTIQSKAPKTVTHYQWAVKSHLIPAVGAVKLEALTVDHVTAMLAASTLSSQGRHHLLNVLRGALSRAVERGILPRNVAALRGLGPKVTRTRPIRFLNPDEARKLLAAATSDRLRALYLTALGAGARQGELLGLRWKDVDFGRGTIQIDGQLQRVKGKLILIEATKTAGSRRTIWMGHAVATALLAHRDRQAVERADAGPRWQVEPDLVFRGPFGLPLDGGTVTNGFGLVVGAAGLPHMTFHDLRHSFASLALALGVGMKEISEALGHSSIVVTMNQYSHLMPAGRAAAAEAMDKVLLARDVAEAPDGRRGFYDHGTGEIYLG